MPNSSQSLYGEIWGNPDAEFDEIVSTSLSPRDAECLYDMFGECSVGPGRIVLDVGSRDAKHAVELVKRFGCRVLAADPIPLHFELARDRITNEKMADRVTVLLAGIEQLPLDDAAIDFVWARDVLNHVDLAAGLAECRRVLRSGGIMFVYQTFATNRLEPAEAKRLFAALATVPANMSPSYFETTAATSGFEIIARDQIDSEWRERWLEQGESDLAESLLQAARMRRREDQLVARFGRPRFEARYGGRLWGIYQMLGKLCPTVYLLRASGELRAYSS